MLLATAVEANACFLKHICLIYATPHPAYDPSATSAPSNSLPRQNSVPLDPLLPTQEQKFCRAPLPAELPLLNPKESAWADGK